MGDATRAREFVAEAIETSLRTEFPVAEICAQLARTRILSTLDGVAARDEIESALDRALSLVRSTGARAYEPQVYVERARLAGMLSESTVRDDWLREAHRLFTEMGATGHAERVALLLAEPPQ